MKPILVLIIIMTLFSFITARVICGPDLKIICAQRNLTTCKCVSKTTEGYFAVSLSCNPPQKPLCDGNTKNVRCICTD